ncbi:hypothetical protein DL98DRAFT_617257 [Cadophora sp. DSE1049]|nr:hypothetical protein DL98DRAFT_617257 [Cadophora sp. DSE1049]
MDTETQDFAKFSSVEDIISLENRTLRQDLKAQKQENSNSKAQLDNLQRKFQEFRIFHAKVKSMIAKEASEFANDKNATIESLERELENTRWDYKEVLDEIRIAGDELRIAGEDMTRMRADGQELERRLDEEEETNRQLRLQLENANRDAAVFSEQRERDLKRIQALEQDLDAAKREPSQGSEKREVRGATMALISMTGRALQKISKNTVKEGKEQQNVHKAARGLSFISTGSTTQSGFENVQQKSERQTRGVQVAANVTSRHVRENLTLQSSSCDHTDILLGIVHRNIAEFEAEKFGRGADAGKLVKMYQGLKYDRRDWFFAGSDGHRSRDCTMT